MKKMKLIDIPKLNINDLVSIELVGKLPRRKMYPSDGASENYESNSNKLSFVYGDKKNNWSSGVLFKENQLYILLGKVEVRVFAVDLHRRLAGRSIPGSKLLCDPSECKEPFIFLDLLGDMDEEMNFSGNLVDHSRMIPIENGIFISEINFSKISKDISFTNCCFLKKISFVNLTIKHLVTFPGSVFNGELSFNTVTAEKEVTCMGSQFNAEVNILLSTFQEIIIFSDSTFSSKLNIGYTEINNFDLLSIDFKEGSVLDFKNVKINFLSYSGESLFEVKVENRKTFLVLKQLALKQSDHISALRFHKKEYEEYLKELKAEKKRSFDYWILLFEKNISEFGTSVGKAMAYLIGVNIFIFMIYHCFNPEHEGGSSFLDHFNHFAVFVTPFHGEFGILNLIMLIINSVLLYEVIKSFRKYSRRL